VPVKLFCSENLEKPQLHQNLAVKTVAVAKKFFMIAHHIQNNGIPKDLASSKRSEILESPAPHW
jgi:hypothetical protein